MELERVILGSNPFIGVSYLSQERRQEYLERFSKSNHIVEVINVALRFDVKSITCSNNKIMLAALEKAHKEAPDLQVFPIIPNVYEYVRKSGGGISKLLENVSAYQKFSLALKAVPRLKGILSKDTLALFTELVDLELAPFSRYKIPAVILHGQVTDLGVSSNNFELFNLFRDIIKNNFGADPALATHNLGRLLPKLDEWGVDIRTVMAPINKLGYMMNPSFDECLRLLRETKRYIIAKKILAGGRLDPKEAMGFIAKEKSVKSVAIGVGSLTEAYHTLSVAKSILATH